MLVYARSFGKILQEDLEKSRKASIKNFTRIIEEQNPNLAQIIFFGFQGDSIFSRVLVFQLAQGNLFNKWKLKRNGETSKIIMPVGILKI